MKDTYKKLHSEWKAAKKSAKSIHGMWDRMLTDFSTADVEVKFTAPRFPKFAAALGPNLDNLEAGKNVEKSHFKATKAAKDYKKEIKALLKAIDKTTPPKAKNGDKVQRLLLKEVGDLLAIIRRIETRLAEKPTEAKSSKK